MRRTTLMLIAIAVLSAAIQGAAGVLIVRGG